MTIEDLEGKIKTKAAQEAQRAISQFRTEVTASVKTLFRPPGYFDLTEEPYKFALLILAGERDRKHGWPSVIWGEREKKLRDEIMSTMDTLQRVLLVKKAIAPSEDTAEEATAEAQ